MTDRNNAGLSYFAMSRLDGAKVFLTGVLIGAFAPPLAWAIDAFFMTPTMCQGENYSYCENSYIFSVISSAIIIHFFGLVLLTRIGVLRPLIVVVSSALTVWSSMLWITNFSLPSSMIYSGIVIGLVYLYYTWINRLKSFPLAFIISIVSILAISVFIAYR